MMSYRVFVGRVVRACSVTLGSSEITAVARSINVGSTETFFIVFVIEYEIIITKRS